MKAVDIARAASFKLSSNQLRTELWKDDKTQKFSLSFIQNHCHKEKLKRLAILEDLAEKKFSGKEPEIKERLNTLCFIQSEYFPVCFVSYMTVYKGTYRGRELFMEEPEPQWAFEVPGDVYESFHLICMVLEQGYVGCSIVGTAETGLQSIALKSLVQGQRGIELNCSQQKEVLMVVQEARKRSGEESPLPRVLQEGLVCSIYHGETQLPSTLMLQRAYNEMQMFLFNGRSSFQTQIEQQLERQGRNEHGRGGLKAGKTRAMKEQWRKLEELSKPN